MKHTITIYCPDQHILYNLHTLDEIGVGGGITTRVRLAHTFADLGNDVTLLVNCPGNEIINHVNYQRFDSIDQIHTDILVVSTSGKLDLSSLQRIHIEARWKALLVHGIEIPSGFEIDNFDQILLPSNFMLDYVSTHWQVPRENCFVSYRGVDEGVFNLSDPQSHDPYKLVYIGHPSKGLKSAIALLSILRKTDGRFSLHVFGGSELWGELVEPASSIPGVYDHGLIGQKQLSRELEKMGFSINLQSRQEPFGMVITESMRKGCIVLASPVGTYPEIIQDGSTGFLFPGDPLSETMLREAADLILYLIEHPKKMEEIRQNAVKVPFSWKTICETWLSYWDYRIESSQRKDNNIVSQSCAVCGGQLIALADGLHCMKCGRYQKGT